MTNANRQIQAVAGAIARPKAQVLAERVRLINPRAHAEPIESFYDARSSDALLGLAPDFIVDAIDNVTAKCHLLAACRGASCGWSRRRARRGGWIRPRCGWPISPRPGAARSPTR